MVTDASKFGSFRFTITGNFRSENVVAALQLGSLVGLLLRWAAMAADAASGGSAAAHRAEPKLVHFFDLLQSLSLPDSAASVEIWKFTRAWFGLTSR